MGLTSKRLVVLKICWYESCYQNVKSRRSRSYRSHRSTFHKGEYANKDSTQFRSFNNNWLSVIHSCWLHLTYANSEVSTIIWLNRLQMVVHAYENGSQNPGTRSVLGGIPSPKLSFLRNPIELETRLRYDKAQLYGSTEMLCLVLLRLLLSSSQPCSLTIFTSMRATLGAMPDWWAICCVIPLKNDPLQKPTTNPQF